ncbi:MAG TPA: hypothetical protein DD435_15555 [Cyanobacteria bacterium UBA8530]|nr:hypothetical protein [Cyanobacteria bacterium UBA8530]
MFAPVQGDGPLRVLEGIGLPIDFPLEAKGGEAQDLELSLENLVGLLQEKGALVRKEIAIGIAYFFVLPAGIEGTAIQGANQFPDGKSGDVFFPGQGEGAGKSFHRAKEDFLADFVEDLEGGQAGDRPDHSHLHADIPKKSGKVLP